MADADSRIRELEKRVAREPGSRSFVPLADEYRRAGRLPDAIKTLEGGLLVHEGYVAARVALARALLEAGRIEDSMAAFSRALADDPSNLVAAKALGDLHLSRGETLEALKRYLRYRAISGDRRLDALIERLQAETGPAQQAPEGAVSPLPAAVATPRAPAAPITPPLALADPMAIPPFEFAPRRQGDSPEISGISYKRPSGSVPIGPDSPEVLSRDVSLDAMVSAPKVEEEIITRKIRLPEATWPFEPPRRPTAPVVPPVAEAQPVSPSGRTLADLYFEQQHYSDAARIYAELSSGDPGNDELRRLRDEAGRLAQSPPPLSLPAADPERERRLEKIRVLNEWLTVIQTGAAKAGDS